MLPLIDPDTEQAVERANAAIERFADLFERHWLEGMRAKLGLFTEEAEDRLLAEDLLAWMQLRTADFTNTFGMLSSAGLAEDAAKADPEFDGWHSWAVAG